MEKNEIPSAIQKFISIFKKNSKKQNKKNLTNTLSLQITNQPNKQPIQKSKTFVFNDATYFDMDTEDNEFFDI